MICIAWGGMPAYAACAIRGFVEQSEEEVRIIATHSDVPRTCDDAIAGVLINWVRDDDKRPILSVIGEMPRILVVSGWFIPSFNSFSDEVRRSGGYVIALIDHRGTKSLHTFAWLANFRLRRRKLFTAFMVPGASGRELLLRGGVTPSRIATGMYTSDPDLFVDGGSLEARSKRIVFVGRFDARKNILPFANAFCRFAKSHPEWHLDCYGCGPLQSDLIALASSDGADHLKIHDFVQPQELPGIYASARIMVLPSLDDHWGVVVHEAALCGCALLLSKEVGAARDLCGCSNGLQFAPKSRSEMESALEAIDSWSEDDWRNAHNESVRLAASFSPVIFARNLQELIVNVL